MLEVDTILLYSLEYVLLEVDINKQLQSFDFLPHDHRLTFKVILSWDLSYPFLLLLIRKICVYILQYLPLKLMNSLYELYVLPSKGLNVNTARTKTRL